MSGRDRQDPGEAGVPGNGKAVPKGKRKPSRALYILA